MRLAGGLVVLALLLAGCSGGGTAEFKDAVAVDNVPACRTWPIELAGDTYWEMTPGQVGEWTAAHKVPGPDTQVAPSADAQAALDTDIQVIRVADTPQVHASAAWPDGADGRGTLYRYDDGTALFIASTGNRIYFTDVERKFDAVC